MTFSTVLPGRCSMNVPELPGAEVAELPFISVEARRVTLSLLDSVGAFESGPVGAWNFVNTHLCELLGVPASSLLGREWIKLIHPDDVQRTVSEYKQARDARRSWRHRFRMRRHDGSIVHVQVDASPLPKDSGTRGISYLGVVIDVSAQQRAQEHVEEARVTLWELLQVIEEGVIIHRDGWIVAANDYLAQMLGYPDWSALIGVHGSQIVAPEDHPVLEAIARSDAPAHTVATFIRPDGGRVRMSLRGRPVWYAGAPARAVILMPLDTPMLTQLTKARVEAQFDALRRQLTLPYNQLRLRDDRLIVSDANQAYADFVGRPLAEVIGIDLRELVPVDINEEIWRNHTDNLRAGRRRPTFLATYRRPDGSLVQGLVHTVDYRDPVTDEPSSMSFVVPM